MQVKIQELGQDPTLNQNLFEGSAYRLPESTPSSTSKLSLPDLPLQRILRFWLGKAL